jgi:isovaleryl-CoA dehydrogenase
LVESVRKFAKERILPRAREIDATNVFPRDLWPQMGEMGLFGVTVSEEFGGLNLGYQAQCLVMEELSRASASVGLSYAAHANLCVNQIFRNGSDGQRRKFLPRLLSGEHVGALAMSEVGAGSDVLAMNLQATKTDSGNFLLNGTKMWITNGPDADVFVIYAKTGPERVSAFLLDRAECPPETFQTSPKLDKLGMRGSGTCELVFQNCPVGTENLLGAGEGHGVQVLMSGLDYERAVLAAGPLGIMQACMDVVLPYTTQRHQFNRPICDFQLVQGKLADMYTSLSAVRAYVYSIARVCDNPRLPRDNKDCAAVILFAAEQATQTALNAIQLLGGNGYTNEFPVARFLRDAKLYEIGAGTSEIRRMIIGKELAKLSQDDGKKM